jgi:5'-nucleotidase
VVSWEGDPILLDAQVVPDAATLDLVAPLRAELQTFTGRVVGSAAVRLVGEEKVCRGEECNLGNLIADALLEATAPQGVEIALHNGGGIRSSLAPGEITVGAILEVLPFGNTVSTFGLHGRDLLQTLEHAVSRAENLDNDGTGRFMQVAGLRFAWSASAPVGRRIQKVEVRQPDGSFQPLDPDRVYRVACNNFNRTGGDGFIVLQGKAIDPYDLGAVVADVVQRYIEEHSPVEPRVEGRITRWQ